MPFSVVEKTVAWAWIDRVRFHYSDLVGRQPPVKTPIYYGYNIVAASFLIQGVAIGGNFAYGVLFKELEMEFGWSRARVTAADATASAFSARSGSGPRQWRQRTRHLRHLFVRSGGVPRPCQIFKRVGS